MRTNYWGKEITEVEYEVEQIVLDKVMNECFKLTGVHCVSHNDKHFTPLPSTQAVSDWYNSRKANE